jgi:hypothetical protein
MANIITRAFQSGFRLFNGTDLNSFRDQVNNAFNGTTAFPMQVSVATGLTAAGTNQATALPLTKALNVVATAAASTGVLLPDDTVVGVGGAVTVYNDGANAIKVYATGSDTIDGTAGATGVTLTNAKRCRFVVVSVGAWKSDQLGVVSA